MMRLQEVQLRSGRLRGFRGAMVILTLLLVLGILGPECIFPAGIVNAAEGYDQVASSSDQAAVKDVVKYGMVPIRAGDVQEGSYEIEADSSSTFFRIDKAILRVKGGQMSVDVTLSSSSYKYIYPGKAQEAAEAKLADYIEPTEKDGRSNFRLQIDGLNQEIPCAAFSKRKKLWYDRNLLFDAGSLPPEALKIDLPDYDRIQKAIEAEESSERSKDSDDSKAGKDHPQLTDYDPVELDMKDGEYSIQVNMTGGSGRASVTSPTWLIVRDGKAWARLLWSSTYYDYMIVGGKKYLNETTDGGNSSFTIPIAVMDQDMPVIADTTAMGDPVEIEYQLTFYQDSIAGRSQIPQEAAINVLVVALIIIAGGGILNFLIKRRRKQ